jgi:hypothetical protein
MSQSKRKILALKIFILAVPLNILMLYIFFDADVPPEPPAPEGIVLKLRGELMTPFEKFKKVTLLNTRGLKLGPVVLIQENGENLEVIVNQNLYRKHFHALTQDNWMLLPELPLIPQGASYEISY